MFQQFKNIDTAFKHIKTFSIFLILANVATLCFGIYKSRCRCSFRNIKTHVKIKTFLIFTHTIANYLQKHLSTP